jgi:hypothetical protein
LCCLGKEDQWVWSFSGEDISDSSWGPNCPNNDPSNTDDCALMVVQSSTAFWWQDASCLTPTVQDKEVGTICQHKEIETTPTSTPLTTTTVPLTTTLPPSTTLPPTTTLHPTTTTQLCQQGWSEFRGHCYMFINTPLDWANAEKNCVQMGAHLASTHSWDEQVFVFNLSKKYAWLGGSDIKAEVIISNMY